MVFVPKWTYKEMDNFNRNFKDLLNVFTKRDNMKEVEYPESIAFIHKKVFFIFNEMELLSEH